MITWLRRPSRFSPRSRVALVIVLAIAAAFMWQQSAPGSAKSTSNASQRQTAVGSGAITAIPTSPQLVSTGQELFDQHCASCHGLTLRGRSGVAPSLIGVGAGSVDFYLSTGRMPLANPNAEPEQESPAFSRTQMNAIIDYVRHVGGGPPAPAAKPTAGSLALGFELFDENCAGCHSIVARGGISLEGQVPDLQSASAREIAEAVRTGPYLMPRFGPGQLTQHDLDSIARYVLWTRTPDNAGGWGIYNIGPIPEGIVAWFVGLLALVILARLIGERAE